MPDLWQRSIDIIAANQSSSGAWVASPSFPVYRYSWLRDGSFIAHAMDRVGEHASAAAFFRWAARTITRHAGKVERVESKLCAGLALDESDYLHTRFTLAGEEAEGDWGNFQLDGYGTWLWALSEHLRRTGDAALLADVTPAVDLTVRYVSALWRVPNYDCWEEHPAYLHPYTLAAIYAGLRAAAGLPIAGAARAAAVAGEVRRFLLDHAVHEGRLVKSLDPTTLRPALREVDASLMGTIVPYRLLAPGDPIARATLAAIERDLHRPRGGVYRYLADTYYGGGEWVLLAAWLGWCYAEAGDVARAAELRRWVEAQADAQGHLPEQVAEHALAPGYVAEWESRWGAIARPLLWSHAMYLILCQALGLERRPRLEPSG